jgi:hypothetical protein
MSGQILPASRVNDFAEAEDAGITVLSLFLFLGMIMASALAIDFNNMMKSQTQLQGAADAAGHAALYWSWRHGETEAKAKAIEIAERNMPTSIYGNVLATVDIEFGDWDGIARTFTPGSSDTAVRVTTRRTAENSNGLGTFLLKFIGMNVLDFTTVSVWDYEEGWCPRGEGFFAVGVVDIQSNNTYRDGFCVHSQTHVEFNQNSTFEDGVVVSMPDESDLAIPNSGMDNNTGLEKALDSITHNLDSFFEDLPELIGKYEDPYSEVNEPMITNKLVNSKTMNSNVTAADIEPYAVNMLGCNGKTLTIDNDVVIRDAVIVTDCEVKFNSGAAIENATLITTNTGSKSISAPSGFRIGAKNYCDDLAGGANLITMGDMTVASGLEAYGANVIAKGNINVTANADGLAGINFMAGGRIDATSNGDLGFCNEGPPQPFDIPVFKMVM